jgi:hypothetical protein
MKQLQLSAIFFLSTFLALNAQPSPGSLIPEGFSPGAVMMPDNTTLEGHIKNNLKKNGEVIILSDGKKTRYAATQVSGLRIENNNYIVVNNAFYKIVTDGVKIKLLRKASNFSSIQYNGSEPIVAGAGEGNYDDYFIQTVATKKIQLVRKKDFAKVFALICADCPTLTDDLKTNKLGFAEIEQAVTLYNHCSN